MIKWRTDDEKLREEINIKETELNNKKMEGGKILGLPWNEKNGTLNLNVQELFQKVRNMPPTRSGLYGVGFHQLFRDNLGTGSFDDISYIDVEKSQFFKSLQNSMVCRTENCTWLHG